MAVSGLVFGVVSWLNRRAAIQQRLDELGHADSTPEAGLAGDSKAVWRARVAKVAGPMARLSTPEEGWDSSALRLRFIHAGLRDAQLADHFLCSQDGAGAPAAGDLCAVPEPASGGAGFSGSIVLLLLLLLVAIGYYLPNVVLVLLSRAGVSRNCAKRCRMRWT